MIASGGNGWTLLEYLTADNYAAVAGVVHPARPVVEKAVDPAHTKRIAAFHKRAAERQRQIDAGEIT